MPQISESVSPQVNAQLPAKLLEMTQDLDIAQALLETLPGWVVKAEPETLVHIWRGHRLRGPLQSSVSARLAALEPLDQFCLERLEAFLLSKGHTLDVQHDVLELPHRELTNLNPDLIGPMVVTVTVVKHTLLQAAMQNFSAARAQANGLAVGALIRSAATGLEVDSLSALEFVRCCRELDLGSTYQRHLREVFDLPAPTEMSSTDLYNPVARDVGELKLCDMRLDLHMALGKGHVSKDTGELLTKVLRSNGDTPPIKHVLMDGQALTWQGLNVDQACIWSVLVFSGGATSSLPTGHCVVYMPNEPERPWFEYDALEDFKGYLSSKLQVPAYREFFKGYLDESERLDFFLRFDTRDAVESLEPVSVAVSLSRFFFDVYVGKAQLDARVLAVPVAEVDEEAGTALLERYVELGLTLANVAGLFIPVLGQLMLGVGVGQLLGEVYEGVEDWRHQHKAEALEHLFNVAESVGSMMLLAAGSKVVGSLFRHTPASSAAFFEQFEAVRAPGGKPRLWRRDLRPYQQTIDDEVLATPSYRGIYQHKGRSYAQIDGALYRIFFDAALGRWRVAHPLRETAYSPLLEYNGFGGWRHQSEQVDQWHTPAYVLERLAPGLKSLPEGRLDEIISTTDSQLPWLRQLAQYNQALPQRLHDSVVRWRQEQLIRDLIWQLQFQSHTDPATARLQMLALPLLKGWPQGRFFELLDEHGNLLRRFPDTAPFDYEDLSIHVSEQQIHNGQLMPTLLDALSHEERMTLLGKNLTPNEAQKVLSARLLSVVKEHYGALFEQLCTAADPLPRGSATVLKSYFPQLPTPMAQHLVAQSSSLERLHLHNTRRVPLGLAHRAQQALQALQEDRAVAGFYLPQLATTPTERLAIALLGKLPGWPAALRVQLHAQALDGALLGKQESASASVLRKVVKSADGYQAFDERGVALHDPVPGPSGFYQALLSTLSPAQRTGLGIYDTGERGAMKLQLKLRWRVADERAGIARYLRQPSSEPLPAWREGCVQAAPPEIAPQPPALLRKAKKLFPLFDNAQASTFIEALGADHLARAQALKVLQQRYETLRSVLAAWRSDEAALAKVAGPLADARLSRKIIAQRIEACWRRMSGAGEASRLSLDDMLGGPLPTLPAQINFEHVHHLSLKNMGAGDGVAYFLKHFTRLKSLDLSGNRLTRLPEILSHMSQLESLYLDGNQLVLTAYTRTKLADLRQLKLLNLTGNPLIDPPLVERMLDLRQLVLRECKLKTFPENLWRLPYLENVDLRQNDITELPAWLFDAKRERTQVINLRHNPLSAATSRKVFDYRRQHGVGMGFYEDDIARLNEQAARALWMPDSRLADSPRKETIWQMLKDEPRSDGLFKLLAELGGTADSKYVHEDMAQRVWRVLEASSQRADLAEEVFERAATPFNCDDGAAVSFSALEILVEISDARKQIEGGQISARPLLALGRGLFRLDRLERIALNHSLNHPGTDPLEVSLALRTGLASRFYLPGQPRHMRYARLSGVTPAALSEAELQVKAAEVSPALLRFLNELPFWTDYLKRAYATRFSQLYAPFETRIQAVFDQRETLSDVLYRSRMDSILAEQTVAEDAELQRLTLAAMRADELGVCEIR
ncbi:NEL-type E3 ubiquitin ligase domain-containing protein [Pseudomonas salmasensis]|uniref:NEL-type E3 ubiquitin ligase domain-containing protein n=1 Tax=Pseudomonas salmasensis TaxID=2745514 RepID=UPI001644DCAF|nr:NEL-type E3 ubiquitin ligase domain-containing protein [Pseudomonas salmasensis]QXH79478.1 leucine-rich repeat domain-containing protein [Pseudomonas salmasensis]